MEHIMNKPTEHVEEVVEEARWSMLQDLDDMLKDGDAEYRAWADAWEQRRRKEIKINLGTACSGLAQYAKRSLLDGQAVRVVNGVVARSFSKLLRGPIAPPDVQLQVDRAVVQEVHRLDNLEQFEAAIANGRACELL